MAGYSESSVADCVMAIRQVVVGGDLIMVNEVEDSVLEVSNYTFESILLNAAAGFTDMSYVIISCGG
jgi:hypothetical protein